MTPPPRKITFASPAEPSGASWLINCLLELGIRVDHRPAMTRLWRGAAEAPFWQEAGGRFTLHPRAEIMGKWIPSLEMRESFAFRPDVVVDYRQDLPLIGQDLETVILFLRDPRDALYSMYRRQMPDLSFADFVDLPNPVTLLPGVDHWLLHAQSWRALAGKRVYLFEDYKADASRLLTRILADLGLADYSAQDIDRAVTASGIEQARAAEARYKARHPEDAEVANRAGLVGDWQNHEDGADAIRRISARCGPLLDALWGVDTGIHADPGPLGVAQSRHLAVFKTLIPPPLLGPNGHLDPQADGSLAYLRGQLDGLSADTLARAKRSDADNLQLVQSLGAFALSAGIDPPAGLAQLGDRFKPGQASNMSTLATLLRQRRATPPS